MKMPIPGSHLIILYLLLALILNGCTSLRPLPGLDIETINESVGAGDKVTVVLKAGQEHALTVEQIDADLLIGEKDGQQVRVALQDIKEIRIRKFSIVKTSMLTLGIYGLAYGYAWGSFIGSMY